MTHLIHQRDAEIRGEERGEQRTIERSVQTMLQSHVPIRDIAKFMSLSVEQVEKLAKTLMH